MEPPVGSRPRRRRRGSAAATTPADLSSLVDPFVGTGTGPVTQGYVGTFPGADVPFGMVQWSPDTAPDRTQGRGYDYADTKISGFSLTHLSGAGCSVFGDVPDPPHHWRVAPASRERHRVVLARRRERVTGAVPGEPGIARHHGQALGHDPDRHRTDHLPVHEVRQRLFKVSGSANGLHLSSVRCGCARGDGIGDDRVLLWLSGRLHAALRGSVQPSLRAPRHMGPQSPAPGIFDVFGLVPGGVRGVGVLRHRRRPNRHHEGGRVLRQHGQCRVEPAVRGPGVEPEHGPTEGDGLLERHAQPHRGPGGHSTLEQTFYTALYHCLLDPSVFSDDNGQYEGFDGRVHQARGRTQYTNFSEWDIYRSEIPLLSMIDPSQVSDMVQSLVDDSSQAGWLPKWAVADSDAGTMNGDSADPVIADAYAFGVRGFDTSEALAAMLKGADKPGTGSKFVQERQNLAEYEQLGYVQQHTEDRHPWE